MTITSKQRAKLRSMSNNIDTIFQIGKNGITDVLIEQINDALLARELIKVRVLENSLFTAREAAAEIAEKTGALVVQTLGTRITLYKPNEENPTIVL